MLRDILHHDPSLVFDLRLRTSEGAPPVPPSTAAPSWSVCVQGVGKCPQTWKGNVVVSDLKSAFPPCPTWISSSSWRVICGWLGGCGNDIRAVEDAQSPGESNRQFHHAAYRQWVVWQYGSLGSRRRVVVPSCYVWAIRDRFPDPNGHYVGFIPSRV